MGKAQVTVNNLSESNDGLKRQNKALQAKLDQLANKMNSINTDFNNYKKKESESVVTHKTTTTSNTDSNTGSNITNLPNSKNHNGNHVYDDTSTGGYQGSGYSMNTKMLIYTAPSVKNKKVKIELKRNPNAGTISIGSWMKASLITGGEFPAGASADTQPRTVFLRILNDAVMPNGYRYNLKGCIAMGAGWGSETTHRVYIKVQQVSCTGFAGKDMIAGDMISQVFDSDAHVGLRGKYVANEGYKAFMATMSGLFGGIAGIASQSQGTTYSGATGVTNVLSPTASMRAGGLNGAAGGLGELSKYYIQRMEAVQPFVDVNAGRIVTLIVSQNTPLRWVNRQDMQVPVTADTSTTTQTTNQTVTTLGKQSTGMSLGARFQAPPKMVKNYHEMVNKFAHPSKEEQQKVANSIQNAQTSISQADGLAGTLSGMNHAPDNDYPQASGVK